MSTIAIIPARGGSKGLPGKNVKNFHGKPLIAHSIEHALQAKDIHQVYVSTDCNEIAKISKDYGAEVPFLRPKEMALDTSTTESAVIHFLSKLKEIDLLPTNIMLLQCTSPIRKKNTLDRAIEFFHNNKLDSLLSVCEFHGFIWKNIRNPEASYDYSNRPRRQDITDKNFLETGSFYMTNVNLFLRNRNRLGGKIGTFITSQEESYEIDTHLDFLLCEKIYKSFIEKGF